MTTPSSPKIWVSPLVTVSFVTIAVTGILLFFHIKNGAIEFLHEWAGWVFIAAGLVHLFLHWRAILGYLRLRRGQVSAILGLAVLVTLLAIGLGRKQERHGPQRGERPPTEVGK
jgi:hypothetical protein